MTVNGYTSRNIPDPKIFSDVLENRMKAKRAGDTKTANSLKLICNTTYGATLNRYNALYDPLQARSVCISGQLYLVELACHLMKDIEGLRLISLNTDAVQVEFDDSQYDAVNEIVNEWQQRTGFELEEDKIRALYAKDVNNYCEIQYDGTVKCKGGYLVKGISTAGAFKVNNNAIIVATAIRECLVNGTDPEITVNACNDLSQFQIIAKAGASYREAYHMVDGDKVPVQKVNRVYSAKDPRYGKIYKVKTETDSEAKIDSLPEHCLIDNDNHCTIDDIDKSFYVEMARKRIDDFKGIKPEKKGKRNMATKATETPKNVWQKLMDTRLAFLSEGVKKSGKNLAMKYKFFELDNIVPVAMPLFQANGIFPYTYFTEEHCCLDVIDMEDPSQAIHFITPMREWTGNTAVNPIQSLGATITYMRRYLLMLALDIVEADEMDAGILNSDSNKESAKEPAPVEKPAPAPIPVAAPAPIKSKIPISQEKRTEVKENLTDANGPASELQITQLKKKLKEVRAAAPEKEDWITDTVIATKSFKQVTKADCERILQEVSKILAEKKGA